MTVPQKVSANNISHHFWQPTKCPPAKFIITSRDETGPSTRQKAVLKSLGRACIHGALLVERLLANILRSSCHRGSWNYGRLVTNTASMQSMASQTSRRATPLVVGRPPSVPLKVHLLQPMLDMRKKISSEACEVCSCND